MTIEDGRGAVSLLGAVRSACVLNSMSKEEAEKAGVIVARQYFRDTDGWLNLAPPTDGSDWYNPFSVSLGSDDDGIFGDSDKVAVVKRWEWPDLTADATIAHLREAQKIVSQGRFCSAQDHRPSKTPYPRTL